MKWPEISYFLPTPYALQSELGIGMLSTLFESLLLMCCLTFSSGSVRNPGGNWDIVRLGQCRMPERSIVTHGVAFNQLC